MARARGAFGAGLFRGARAADLDLNEVARVAYALYEQRGRVDGHALEDWLNAEAALREAQQRRSPILATG